MCAQLPFTILLCSLIRTMETSGFSFIGHIHRVCVFSSICDANQLLSSEQTLNFSLLT